SGGMTFLNGSDLTLNNNTLTNDATALYVDTYTDGGDADTAPMSGTGNVVTNSGVGFQLWHMSGLTIGTSAADAISNNATAGFQSTGTAFSLRNFDNSTISNLDLSWSGATRTGVAITADSPGAPLNDGLTIQGVNAANRVNGINIGGGADLTVLNCTLTND